MSDHPHDQEFPLTTKELALFEKVNSILEEAEDQWFAFSAGEEIRRALVAGGVALSQLMYGIWCKFYKPPADRPEKMNGPNWESFKNDAVDRLGLSRQTVEKYTEMYHWVVKGRPAMLTKPVGALILIRVAAKEQIIHGNDWARLEMATDKAQVREIIRDIKDDPVPIASAVTILITPEGHLKAKKGDEPGYQQFGFLTPNPVTDGSRIARERMLRTAGVIKV